MKQKKIINPFVLVQITALFAVIFLSSMQTTAQKRQLTPSDTVTKIGFIDHSRLRKEYREMALERNAVAGEFKTQQEKYQKSLQALNNESAKKLRQDSLKGNLNYEKIQAEALIRRNKLLNEYQTQQKSKILERNKLLGEFEKKIGVAIGQTVSEGGFTDIQPIEKKVSGQRGNDITNVILKKLN